MPRPAVNETIRRRLANQTPFDLWRRKVHGLRKTLAGDHSQFGRAPQRYDQDDSATPDHRLMAPSGTTADLYDVLVMDYESGRGNDLLIAARTLLYTVSFGQPQVTFDNLDDISATFHSAYLARRMRECNAHHHQQLALLDAIVGGLGWSMIAFERGVPGIRHADALDVTWDLAPRLSQDIRWVAVRVRQPLWYWINQFGRKTVLNAVGASRMANLRNEDVLVAMEYYYSTEGQRGRHAVWPRVAGELVDAPIESSDNPFRYDLDGTEVPFLPLRPCTLLAVPSVRFPIGLIETMTPAQIASWEAESTVRAIVARGMPWFEIGPGAFLNDNERQKWVRGDVAAGVQVGQTGLIVPHEGMPLPDALLAWREMNRRELTRASGVSPYASGGTADGVEFASEVNAIEGNAGLVAGMAAKRHAEHWEQTIRALIWTSSRYDDMPLRLRIDGELWSLGQGPDDVRPSDLLDPHADPTIREDDLRYTPMAEQMARWRTVLQDVAPLASAFPSMLPEALRRYLRAAGERNVAAWLEQPAPAPGMAAPGMADPGMGAAPSLSGGVSEAGMDAASGGM